MKNDRPRLVQTYLIDGTLEGPRIVECESSIKAIAVPRIKINAVGGRSELSQPALYFLISTDSNKAYVGETENFFRRIKDHEQSKTWWDVAIAVVSTTNNLEKSDVKYLESLAVERVSGGSYEVSNKTVPVKNNIHEFKLHSLQAILDDTQLILTSLGYDILSIPTKDEEFWYCKTRAGEARAAFRGDSFVVFAGSPMNIEAVPSFTKGWPADIQRRKEIMENRAGLGATVALLKENIAFRSPNDAGQIITGRSINAWSTWKNARGQTMDEVMRGDKK